MRVHLAHSSANEPYIHIHIHIHTHTHIHMYIHTHTYIHIYILTHTYIYMNTKKDKPSRERWGAGVECHFQEI